MLELVEGDFDAFFAAPFHCYGRDGRYVSPMQSDLRRFLSAPRNPLFREHGAGTFFTVRQGGRAVGRVVAHVHRASNRLYGLKRDRKSTRLNSSHLVISYAVFCLKKK